ncbi:methylamine dehydrogenase light chain [Paraglaciecola polaris]|uniref:Methylamine dehydrogenase light chain n=1 Tax=Paraglaciecola polaris LMG 21857 TaxID=1129793 RepID=K7AIM3_9ALTE|nr:methylamine dehydrogenase light chain [Paraglaciecola polaris]GAC35095.1 methylamine dehydrogenase light chain [Paraglaciecola polaris LMG 21857]|tara:strand:- start:1114 stop:1671 length:558 start_codon:yes stop_codon:yes gene_type:complete
MKWFDKFFEKRTRNIARTSSRRSFLSNVGKAVVGVSVIPALPVAKAAGGGASAGAHYPGVAPQSNDNAADPGDPTTCEYWRYCGIDGFLCSCCGGSQSACPPGTEMSPITWIGTCLNPADNKHYIISYNDCCGKAACGRCFCNRNEDDTPMYRAFTNNDTNWCVGASSETYVCSTAVILGTSIEP